MTVKQNTLGWGLGTVGAVALVAAMALISTQSQAQKQMTAIAVTEDAPLSANVGTWVAALSDDGISPALAPTQTSLFKDAAVSQRQTNCLAEAVYYEARSETIKGQKAVAEVVLNRVASRHYPNTICDVVYQGSTRRHGCQFSFTCDGSMDRPRKAKSWKRSELIAAHMMIGLSKPLTNNATHYHTQAVSPRWSNTLVSVGTIGHHKFYQNRRRPVAKTPVTVAP